MPFFEYKCAECDKVFSLLQKRDAERQGYECPACGSTTTERVFSTFATATAGKERAAVAAGAAAGGHCCGGGCGCHH